MDMGVSVSLSTDDPAVLVTSIGNDWDVMVTKVISDPVWNFKLISNGIKHSFLDKKQKEKLKN